MAESHDGCIVNFSILTLFFVPNYNDYTKMTRSIYEQLIFV